MTGALDNKPETESAPEWGPAMQALPEKRRAFVLALYEEDAPAKGDGLLIFAARQAQYGTATSSSKSLSVIANRIVHDDRVIAAIREHSQKMRNALSPEAIRAVRNLIRDPRARDHARAIAMVLDRTDPVETMHTVKVVDHRPPSIEATKEVLARIEALARRAGLIPPPAPTIEGEFQVVEEGAPA